MTSNAIAAPDDRSYPKAREISTSGESGVGEIRGLIRSRFPLSRPCRNVILRRQPKDLVLVSD